MKAIRVHEQAGISGLSFEDAPDPTPTIGDVLEFLHFASLLPADLLIILTTVDGVIENFGKPNPRTLSAVEQIDGTLEKLAGGTNSATAVGGMASKVQAAKIAVRSGIPLVIASGKKRETLARILAGEEEGTLFVPQVSSSPERPHPLVTAFVAAAISHAYQGRAGSA